MNLQTDLRTPVVTSVEHNARATGPTVSRRRAVAPILATLGLYSVALGVGLHLGGQRTPMVVCVASALFMTVLAWLVRRSPLTPRRLAALVLAGGAILQIVAVTAGPDSSDDVYRQIWDGTVQFSGTDPYAYTPQSDQLAHLRTEPLFGGGPQCIHPIPGGCTAINRPAVRTVYPPVAQLLFDGVRAASFGGHGGVLPFQIAGAFGALLIAALLARRALRRRRPMWPVAIWASSPIAVLAYGNNAHIDWFAILLVMGGFALSVRGRAFWGGALVGAAVLTKLYPALVLPALLKRRRWAVLAGVLMVAVVTYAPHVAAVGGSVIGYLPGYLSEEGYRSGARLLLLGWVLPGPLDLLVGGAVLTAVAWVAWRHGDPRAPERAATWTVGAAFLVTTPTYGWYAGLLLVLAVMSEQYEWLPLALAPSFVYLIGVEFTSHPLPQRIVYLVAALSVVVLARVRRGDSLRAWVWSSGSSRLSSSSS